jgi:glycosyltransferase involved in cell wall biosynthesis
VKVLLLTNMYPSPSQPAFGTFVYDQVEAVRRAGVEIDLLFINGRASKLSYLTAFPRLWWRLLRKRYDVIHAHYVLAGVVARAQWRVPVVLTHHGAELLGHPRWQALLCRAVNPYFDEVIYVAERMRRHLADDDGWVIPCGVDFERFKPEPRDEARAKLGLPRERRLVLWAGESWRPEKQFALTQQAVELARRELPDLELVLLSGRPHEVVPTFMNACDALILTSRLEGSPMVVKEAMACNLPIVSVPVGDVEETIGLTPGCRISSHDPHDLAAGLVEVLRSPTRTDGRARIEHVRHDRIAGRVVEVLRRAARSKGSARQHAERSIG